MKCALVGVGYWGSILKPYIEASNFFDLVAVCDSKSDLNKIWSDKSIGAIVVATPIETHYEIVKAALLSGKHVLSEKPLALTTDECLDLWEIAEKKGLVLETDYIFTYSKCLQSAKNYVKSGRLGTVLALELSTKHLGRFGKYDVYWLLASHMLSVLDMFCSIKDLDFCFVDLIEDESGVIFFDGPVKGTISVSLNYPLKDVKAIIYCEKGTIRYDPNASTPLHIISYSKPDWVVANKIPQKDLGLNYDESHNIHLALLNFQRCILGGKKCNIDLAVEVTSILENR